MQYLLILVLPMVIALCGGPFITDENPKKRTIGFTMIVIAVLGMFALVAWQTVDPTFFVL